MRYRRFGRSDLEVSEVGFGVWTLASDWWGVGRGQAGHAARRARRRHQLHRHRAGLRRRRLRRDAARRRAEGAPRRDRPHDQVRLRHRRRAQYPGQSERPQDWQPGVDPRAARGLAAPARHRLHRPLPAAQRAHRARSSTTRCGRSSRSSGPRARSASSGSRSARRSAGSTKASSRSATATIVSLQTVFNVLEQEPGSHVRGRAAGGRRHGRPHLARPARVRHAVGQDHARHRVPARATTARTATATTCSTTSTRPRRSPFLWEGTGRTIGQAAIAGILANPAFTTVLPTCVTVDDVREYAAAIDLPLTDRRARPARRAAGTTTSASRTATRCR